MPLSEHEERILAEIERQLAAEDPRFVARARKTRGAATRTSRTLRIRLAIAMAIIGFLSLLGLTVSIAFGAVGMALLLGAILLGATAMRQKQEEAHVHVPPDEA